MSSLTNNLDSNACIASAAKTIIYNASVSSRVLGFQISFWNKLGRGSNCETTTSLAVRTPFKEYTLSHAVYHASESDGFASLVVRRGFVEGCSGTVRHIDVHFEIFLFVS